MTSPIQPAHLVDQPAPYNAESVTYTTARMMLPNGQVIIRLIFVKAGLRGDRL